LTIFQQPDSSLSLWYNSNSPIPWFNNL